MQLDNYLPWIEILTGAQIALGAWIWRIARHIQAREDRLERIERWRSAHEQEYAALRDTLTRLQQDNAVQTTELRNICRSLDELRADQRIVMSYYRRHGEPRPEA